MRTEILKYLSLFLFGLLILSTSSEIYAQDSLSHKINFPAGITLEYGIGKYAVTDEYISKEKYSGTLPSFRASWTNQHESYVYYFQLEFRHSSEINNYNVNASVIQSSLSQGFLYLVSKFSLFSKKAHLYIGPEVELFVYSNKQNIAISGFDYSKSYAALFSLGFNSALLCPLSESFNLEGALNFNILSIGFRLIDMEESDESDFKLLTLFSGLHGSFSLGVRYNLFNDLSLKAGYQLDVVRISAWSPIVSASDNLTLSITYAL